MEIKRDLYLNRLIQREKNGLVKVVTGVRRCGKSYLLFKLFRRHLLDKGVPEDHIVEIALDDRRNRALRDPDAMLDYLHAKITDTATHYIILDEVQLLAEFEEVLNTLLHIDNTDVYVTGSNSRFLSSDVITEFRGRGDNVRLFPLSFREYVSAFPGDLDEAWDDFCVYGGLPLILSMRTAEQRAEYLTDLFQTVYISDIIERHTIRHPEELEELVNILASAVGSLTSPLKLANTFKSVKNKSIGDKTLKRYMDYLIDSFLVSRALRYDIKGRKYINSPAKFYFEDMGLRNARLGFRQMEENHLMENIVYNELRIRGYHVDVGLVEVFGKNGENKTAKKQLEVDFVAGRGSEKCYIQSAFAMPTPEKREQEERPLNAVPDSFKKIIVVRDNIKPRRDERGIVTMGVRHFLLDENSLYL